MLNRYFRLCVLAAMALHLGGPVSAESVPEARGPHAKGLVVPAHYMGMLVIVQGGPAAADAPEIPAYITGVLNASGGFHDHHKVQGMDRVLPAHQITLTRLGDPQQPMRTIGYWVVPGPKATQLNIRVQDNPPKSLLDQPLATAINVGGEWLPLDNHVTVEYGIATKLLALRYFSQAGHMWANWMQPTPQPFTVKVTTSPTVKLPPHGIDPPPPVMPADADAGKRKSSGCSGCHGVNGISVNDQWPNLAGQRSVYLRKQLTLFRSGERRDPIMNSFAAGLSDEDIEQIANYYAGLPRDACK